MKKDIEWIKDKLFEIAWEENKSQYLIELEDVYEVIDQLNEPEILSQELPVIPKYVGEFIEEVKASGDRLDDAFSILRGIYHQSKTADWVAKENRNSETFARAWLDGYTVADEPLYYALFKGCELRLDSYKNLALYRGTRSPMYISYKHPLNDEFVIKMSKNQWNELGVNDSNANFVKVEEVEK